MVEEEKKKKPLAPKVELISQRAKENYQAGKRDPLQNFTPEERSTIASRRGSQTATDYGTTGKVDAYLYDLRTTREENKIKSDIKAQNRGEQIKNQLIDEQIAKNEAQKQQEEQAAAALRTPEEQAAFERAMAQARQPADNRNPFSKIFFPTAEEAAQRRVETFGTISTAPVAATAAGGAALGAVAGTAAAAGAAAIGIGTTAAATAATATTATAGLLTAALKLTVGAAAGFSYIARRELSDSNGALNLSLDAIDTAFKEGATPEELEFYILNAESNIRDMERALKIAESVDITSLVFGNNKSRNSIANAKQQIALYRKNIIRQQALAQIGL